MMQVTAKAQYDTRISGGHGRKSDPRHKVVGHFQSDIRCIAGREFSPTYL